jgi:hypothetical protein
MEDDLRSNCGGDHVRVKVSMVMNDDPEPKWPSAGMPEQCACGQELEYRHIIHYLIP